MSEQVLKKSTDERVASLLERGETEQSLQEFCEVSKDLVNPDDITLINYGARYAGLHVTSLNAIEHCIDMLMDQPDEEIQQLFERNGVVLTPEDIDRGLINHWLMLVVHMQATDAEIAYEAVEITDNPKLNNLVGETKAWMHFIEDKDALFTLATDLEKESDYDRKIELAGELKANIIEFLKKHRITGNTMSWGSHEDISWEQVVEIPKLHILDYVPTSIPPIGLRRGIKHAMKVLAEMESKTHEIFDFEQALSNIEMPTPEQMDELRLQFGAKGANLLVLLDIRDQIDKAGFAIPSDYRLSIPDFSLVNAGVYRKWKDGEEIDNDIREFFDWTKGRGVIIRSSAVHSEDGEDLTGAGVYDSIRPESSTFEDFKAAILKVYASVDGAGAVAYRSQNGIAEEEMGLVIQEYISPKPGYTGYVNTAMTGIPELMEVYHYGEPRLSYGSLPPVVTRNMINNRIMNSYLGHPQYAIYQNRPYHFPPDTDRVNFDLPLEVALPAKILEKLWGRPVQIEFTQGALAGGGLYLLQIRPIPYAETRKIEVVFPTDQEPIFEGLATGIGDLVLPVLAADDVAGKEGVDFKLSNFAESLGPSDLPASGAVIITTNEGFNGHIQTRCVEKGLICIFHDKSVPHEAQEEMLRAPRLRIVSDGITGRVYRV